MLQTMGGENRQNYRALIFITVVVVVGGGVAWGEGGGMEQLGSQKHMSKAIMHVVGRGG